MPPAKIHENAVKNFNALPRQPRAPSGLVGNHWHFDLRFVYLEPPAHVLFLVQPESTFIHSVRLPLGIPNKFTTLLFFPESGAEAAPEVAKALIHAFLDGFGSQAATPFAPWSLSTDDSELATEVAKEFKRLGIREDLCSISATKAHEKTADEAFAGVWETMTQIIGPPDMVMLPPDGISFSVLKPKPWGEDGDLDEMEKALKYALAFYQVGLDAKRLSNSQIASKTMENTQVAMELLESTSSEEVQKEADAGNDAAALDYAVRIRCNIGVKPSRPLHRYYLLKVIQSETATKEQKSQAHGLLVEWFTSAPPFARYLFAAAHHANQSIILAGDASPAVLWFGHRVFEPQADKVPILHAALAQYKALWVALDKRDAEISEMHSKAEKKREKASTRYICAAPNCYIQASKGGGLSQCSGGCDPAVKPAYCSKACQKADWKNHKPLCKPGAPCSILTKERDLPAAGQGQSADVLTIPIALPDGRPMMLSSSTMTPEMLKMLQAFSLGEKNPEGADKTLDELLKKPRRFEEAD